MADELPLYRNGAGTSFDREKPKVPANANAGLWYERFFNQYEWAKDTSNSPVYRVFEPRDSGQPAGKQRWVASVAGQCGDEHELRVAADKLAYLSQQCDGKSAVFNTDWHFVTGLGNPHPVENGMTWHPTLGVPYIPGSSVKGLVRAWVNQWDEDIDEQERKRRLRQWFGSESKTPESENRVGAFMFFDALPVKSPYLKSDIVNPHMGQWYEAGDTNPNHPDTVPADWHSPVPNFFLVVKDASFRFAIAPRVGAFEDVEQRDQELELVFEALTNALIWIGAGAKTAKGYGGMEPLDELASKQIEADSLAEVKDAFDKGRRDLAQQHRLAKPVPDDQLFLNVHMQKWQGFISEVSDRDKAATQDPSDAKIKELQEKFKALVQMGVAKSDQRFNELFKECCEFLSNLEGERQTTLRSFMVNELVEYLWGNSKAKKKKQKKLKEIENALRGDN